MILAGSNSAQYASGSAFTLPDNQAGDVLIAGALVGTYSTAGLGTASPLVRVDGANNPQSEVAAAVLTAPVASVSWTLAATPGIAWAIVLRPDSGRTLRIGASAKSAAVTTTIITYPALTLQSEAGEDSRVVSVGMRRGNGTAIMGTLATSTPNSSTNIMSRNLFDYVAFAAHWSDIVESLASAAVDVGGSSGSNTEKYGLTLEIIESAVAQPATRTLIGLAASGF